MNRIVKTLLASASLTAMVSAQAAVLAVLSQPAQAAATGAGGKGGDSGPGVLGGLGGTGSGGASGAVGAIYAGGGGGAAGGGVGGNGGNSGGAGGLSGAAGAAGAADGGGGGGGGGLNGQVGGALAAATGIAGGAGGASTAVTHQPGGGGGGAGGFGISGLTTGGSNTFTITGGVGGAGGAGPTGGNGGTGGVGISSASSLTITNTGTITGGAGGAGGAGTVLGGLGGDGGDGVAGSNLTIINSSGTITGGAAGAAGGGGGTAGTGGAAIAGSNLTIINAGTLSGGVGGGAVTFTGGTNSLTLQSGSIITGNVVAFSTADTFALGGTTNASFDVSNIGPAAQYRGFGNFGKTGSSIWTLTGVTAYSGSTTISGGTLSLSGAASIANSNVIDDATFDISGTTSGASIAGLTGGGVLALGSKQLTISNGAGTFSGSSSATSGGITISGGATAFSNTLSYTGATIISGGTLALTGTGSIASSSGVTDNGIFDISGTTSGATLAGLSGSGNALLGSKTLTLNSGNFSGILSGSGGNLVIAGSTTLSGANTYTGATGINSGTLALSGAGSIAGSSSLADLGTFDISQTAAGTSLKSLSGSGIVALGNKTVTLTASGDNFSGVFQDGGIGGGTGGSLAITGGTEILSGTNTYTGATTIGSGATLQIGNNGSTGALGSGAVTDNGTLAYFLSVARTVGNVISGAGGLIQGGAGTLTLTAAQAYTGTTTINTSRTLALSGAGNLVSSAVADAGIFDISGATTGATVASLSGAGAVALGSKNLTIANGSAFAGSIGDGGIGGGTGGNIAINGGTEIFSGTNTYTGTTNIASGATIQVGTGGSTGTLGSGAVIDNGMLVYNRSDAVTHAAAISGSGGLIQAGGGTLTLTAAQAYTGTTTINSGRTLALSGAGNLASSAVADAGIFDISGATTGATVASLSGAGAVALGSKSLTIANGSAFTGAINDGGIGGGTGGNITINGGTEIFSGTNTYTGTTNIASGATIQVGAGGSTGTLGSGAVIDNGMLVYNRSDAVTFATAISGSGGLTQAGGGTLILTGANAYLGATIVSSGILQIGAGGTAGAVPGNIVDNTAIRFNRSDTVTYANVISGGGTVTQGGNGNLIFSGVNTYTGATGVTAGTLSVNGSIAASAVTVAAGARLGGNGTVGTTVISSGGTLAPGNSIGTININGNLSLPAGSIYAVELSPTAADRTNVSGTAVLGGGLALSPASGTYTPTVYHLIAAGSVSGTFASVTGASPASYSGLDTTIQYSATAVDLITSAPTPVIVPAATTPPPPATVTIAAAPAVTFLFNTYGKTPNQIAAGAALTAGPSTGALYLATGGVVTGMASVPYALSQIAGDIHASIRSAAIEDSRIIRNTVLDHLGRRTDDGVIWGTGFGGYGSIATDGNASGLHHESAGLIMGADMPVDGALRLGLAAAYSSNSARVADFTSHANGSMGHVIAYAGWTRDAIDLRLGGDYGWGGAQITRDVTSLSQNVGDHQHQQVVQLFADAGYKFATDAATVEPYIGIAKIAAASGGFTETGGTAALSGGGKTDSRTYSTLGLRAFLGDEMLNGMTITPRADIGWQHAFDRALFGQTVTLENAAQSFTVLGVPLGTDAAAVQLGFDLAVGTDATLSFGYDGSFSSTVQSNAIRGGMNWKF